jgi:hypothetical protein
MKKYTIVVFLSILAISCKNNVGSDSMKERLVLIDSVLTSSALPIMNDFDIRKYLEPGARDWVPINPTERVDSLFYKRFLMDDKILGYWKDYQKLYYLGKIDYKGNKYLIISQWIDNGDECYIYLLKFNSQGRIDKLLLISKAYKSPNDYDYMKSVIENGVINRISIRMSSDNEKGYLELCDSIIEKFNIEDFHRVYYDSIGKK